MGQARASQGRVGMGQQGQHHLQQRAEQGMGLDGLGWAGWGGASPLCSERVCGRSAWLRVWARPPGSDTPGSFCFSLLNPPCPRSRFSPLVSLFVHPRSPHRRLRSTAHPFLFPLPTSTFAFLTTVTPLKIIGTISLDSLEIRSFLPVSICFVSCLFSLLFFALGPAFFLLRSRGPLFHNTIPRPDALPPARTPFVQDDTPLQRPIFPVFFLFIHSFSTHHYHHYHHYPLGISPNCGSSCASTATDLGQPPPLRSPHSINHTPPFPSAGCVPAIGVWDQGKDNTHFNTDDTPITNKSTRPKWRPT